MTKAHATWIVLPHRPIERPSVAVMTVTGDLRMPLTVLDRRMTAVRLRDGRLVIYSAIALDDAQMRVLEDFGTPSFLVVPNAFHRQDALAWKQRYPALVVVAPPGARQRIEEVVPVDTVAPELGDPDVRFVVVAGTEGREAALEVREGERVTLVVNDIIGNLPKEDGLVLRALGFAGDRPRVPRMVRRMLIADTAAFREQLEAWSEMDVARILVSHGRPIERAPREDLREMARSL